MTSTELRLWAREVFPCLEGMSWRQVQHNRRAWRAAVAHLGDRWLIYSYRNQRRRRDPRPLTRS